MRDERINGAPESEPSAPKAHEVLDSDGMTGGRTHHKKKLGVEQYGPILLLRWGARPYKLILTLTVASFSKAWI